MKNKRYLTVILLGVMLITLSGCIGVNRQFKVVRTNVLSNIEEGTFKKEVELSVGKGLITLGSVFVSFADTDVDVKNILRNLDRVQVGVYKNVSRNSIDFSRADLISLCDLMESGGMQYIVRTRERNEFTGIFVDDRNEEHINTMYVVHADRSELVIVEIKGDIDDIISIAMKEANKKIEFEKTIAMH